MHKLTSLFVVDVELMVGVAVVCNSSSNSSSIVVVKEEDGRMHA